MQIKFKRANSKSGPAALEGKKKRKDSNGTQHRLELENKPNQPRRETTANPHPLALFILLNSFIRAQLFLSSLALSTEPPPHSSQPKASNSNVDIFVHCLAKRVAAERRVTFGGSRPPDKVLRRLSCSVQPSKG